MLHFQNILYVGQASEENNTALEQAVSLAQEKQAVLTILILAPVLPGSLGVSQEDYEAGLVQGMKARLQTVKQTCSLAVPEDRVRFAIETDTPTFVKIIQRVIRDGHDLVLKVANTAESGKGFDALDMSLMRKCPAPVWMCRSWKREDGISVAVAIDPFFASRAEHDLEIRLLHLSAALAERFSTRLQVISCWEMIYEKDLKENPFVKVDQANLEAILTEEEHRHREGLNKLLAEAALPADSYDLHMIKGKAERIIASYVGEKGIDILVMGTLARTGIPGFFIGNTAENVLQSVSSSLVTIKPAGFVSPVTLK